MAILTGLECRSLHPIVRMLTLEWLNLGFGWKLIGG
jgi:hypothetical protein